MKRKVAAGLLGWCLIVLMVSWNRAGDNYQRAAASCYDRQLDSLDRDLEAFARIAARGDNNASRRSFLQCRNRYKHIEFFVEQFDPPHERMINGPDLMKIEDDNPRDTLFPQGFQRIEAMLWRERAGARAIGTEVKKLRAVVQGLRRESGHEYYFKHAQVWEAMRGGVYRVVALGITGFDVPYCFNAMPESATELQSIRELVSGYAGDLRRTKVSFAEGEQHFQHAIQYLKQHPDFNAFDRGTFIRDYMNPLTAWMASAQQALGYVNAAQLTPLNPYARTLFDSDIFDIRFFSPNEQYRPDSLRISLGKRLFYEPRLSGTGLRSCASCHQADKAFADGLAKPKSLIGDTDLLRNTPTLWYSVFQKKQFYDSRTEALEYQLSDVVHNAAEMGGSLADFIPVLQQDSVYPALFRDAYAHDRGQISQFNIANAICSFIRSLTGFDSRFDRYIRKEGGQLTAGERHGLNVFMGKGKCGTCHYAPVFNGLVPPKYNETESEILAVPATAARRSVLDGDEGKFRFTRVALHRYAFRTPALRNVARTAPYMHNGVYRTLREVIDFYDRGGGAGYGIRLDTQTLPTDELHLTEREKRDLEAFLRTLDTEH